jgi:hypothetical protein
MSLFKKKKKTIVELKIKALNMMIESTNGLQETFDEWLIGRITDRTFSASFGAGLNNITNIAEMLKKRAIKEEDGKRKAKKTKG